VAALPGEGFEGPLVVPVHNLGAGGNTPPYWLPPPRGLGWPHALFNAYYLRGGHRASSLGPLVAWVDSGAFLFLEAPQRRLAGLHRRRGAAHHSPAAPGWSEELAAEVLRRQEAFGAAYAFTLDHPLPPESQLDPTCCPGVVARRLRDTAAAAGIAYQLRTRRSTRIIIVLQYNGPEALARLYELLRRELRERAGIAPGEADGYAVGGLVPHAAKWWLLARRLQEARRLLGWGTRLHLLGVASPHNIPLLYAAGADSMDSKTYIIAAAKRLYYQPPGARPARVDLREAATLPPSPVLGPNSDPDRLRRDTRLLALHNLATTLQAAATTANAHRENRLHQLLKQLARNNPKLAKALNEITTPRPGKNTPH
jgi:7-cyano-7-deazaguanine tRNA-ribosyltransferase